MQTVGASIILLMLFSVEVFCLCPPKTECFGHGLYNRTAETCNCSSSIKGIGPYTGECCESIGCKSNATCKHGFCGSDGITCANCQTGWGGDNCTEVKSCFSWFTCAHGSCIESRSTCECEPGWVGDLCDRTVCLVPCKFGSCPQDPKKCECHEHYFGKECEKSICGTGWECHNGGYCIDRQHCVCPLGYTGPHCEIVIECSVPCKHGTCPNKHDLCECELHWGPPGKCNVYQGPCFNCSAVGGTCTKGPSTCECNPGYSGVDCSAKSCDGCEHGRCFSCWVFPKKCKCDLGWTNEHHVRGFHPLFGPCTKVLQCMKPCIHGRCLDDPYTCKCTAPYVGRHCEVIKCPVCCPPQTCDCSNPDKVRCLPNWHHDCCLVKSCFRGDTPVHTDKGLVPIENIKEGDMVVTRHEGEGPSVTHLRRVDQVRKQFVPMRELLVFRMADEDIWVTPDHPFFEIGTGSWISAVNVSTSYSLLTLKGAAVKLQHHLKASQLLASSDEVDNLVAVYDLSVHEYDRYSVGKDGLLVSACNSIDLTTRDKQVWGEKEYPNHVSGLHKKEVFKAKQDDGSIQVDSNREALDSETSYSSVSAALAVSTVGLICLVLVSLMTRKYFRGEAKAA